MALLFLYPLGWVVNATPRPLYHQERLGAHCIESWVGPRAGLYSPTGIRSPDHPSRSESLYRLRHLNQAEEFSIKRII
jgi:hypothetical protein